MYELSPDRCLAMKELLSVVEESYELEDKLTVEKRDYYNYLKTIIGDKYHLLTNRF